MLIGCGRNENDVGRHRQRSLCSERLHSSRWYRRGGWLSEPDLDNDLVGCDLNSARFGKRPLHGLASIELGCATLTPSVARF